jgi:hypothetical protein
MANTPVYGWETPDDTDYVYQGAAAARTTANSIDSTLSTQVSTINASIATTNSNLSTTNGNLAAIGQGWVSWTLNNSTVIVTSTTETTMFSGGTFTPRANRVYSITYSIGNIQKTTNAGILFIYLRKNVGGAILDRAYMSSVAAFEERPFTKTLVLTSAELGTSAFTPAVSVQANNNGVYATNAYPDNGTIVITDLGAY